MRYLSTTAATDWSPQRPRSDRLLRALLWFIPRANPDYDDRLSQVTRWLIEFDEDGRPYREIGLDGTNRPVLAGPNDRNYGFWLDTNMKFSDFQGDAITTEQFESVWRQWQQRGAG